MLEELSVSGWCCDTLPCSTFLQYCESSEVLRKPQANFFSCYKTINRVSQTLLWESVVTHKRSHLCCKGKTQKDPHHKICLLLCCIFLLQHFLQKVLSWIPQCIRAEGLWVQSCFAYHSPSWQWKPAFAGTGSCIVFLHFCILLTMRNAENKFSKPRPTQAEADFNGHCWVLTLNVLLRSEQTQAMSTA